MNNFKYNDVEFANQLLVWSCDNFRRLPWRQPFPLRDPYKVWISEIMLQQTQVNTVIPYFKKFIKAFPTVADLSTTSEEEVLLYWQGLGYYSRARNLKLAAKVVCKKYNGFFPSSISELLLLPGIGNYTANAIASFAFCFPTQVIDANVGRVISRLFGIDLLTTSSNFFKTVEFRIKEMQQFIIAEEKFLFKKKLLKIPNDKHNVKNIKSSNIIISTFNEALIEFGALYCTAKNPNCARCIFKNKCIANLRNLVNTIPNKKKKKAKTVVTTSVMFLQHRNKLLVRKRLQPASGRMENLWEFVSLEHEEMPSSAYDMLIKWTNVVINAVEKMSVKNNNSNKAKLIKYQQFFLRLVKKNNNEDINSKDKPFFLECIDFAPFTIFYTSYKVNIAGWFVKINNSTNNNLNGLLTMLPNNKESKEYLWATPAQLQKLPMATQNNRLVKWHQEKIIAKSPKHTKLIQKKNYLNNKKYKFTKLEIQNSATYTFFYRCKK